MPVGQAVCGCVMCDKQHQHQLYRAAPSLVCVKQLVAVNVRLSSDGFSQEAGVQVTIANKCTVHAAAVQAYLQEALQEARR